MSNGEGKLRRLDRWMLAVGAVGVLVRLVYVGEGPRDPSFAHPIIDASMYDHLAVTIAQGLDPWRGGPFSRPPLYPYLLATLYLLFGPNLAAARVFQALLGGGTCILTCLLGQRVFSYRLGLAGGLIGALYGPLVFLDETLQGTSLEVFCFCLALLAAVRAVQGSTWLRWLCCGLAIGLAALARPTIAMFLIVVVVWIAAAAVRERRWGRGVGRLAGLLGGCLAAIAPATIRNYVVGHEFVPICFVGGLNLYLGNNPDSDSTIAIRPGPAWERLVRLPHANGMVSSAQTEKYFLKRVLSYARSQPADFVAGLVHKARLFCSGVEIPRNYDLYLHRQYSSVLRVLIWRLGPFGFPFGVVAPLAVLGMVVARRARPGAWMLIGYVLACAASVILFFVAGRYRVPIVPVLALFAAWAVAWWWGQLGAGRYLQSAAAAAGLLLVGVFVNLPVRTPYDNMNFEADLQDSIACRLILEGDLAGAERAFRKALELTPDSAELHNSLSYVLEQFDRTSDALRHARTAVELDPDLADARVTLGRLLASRGDFDEAAEHLHQAIALDPGNPDAASALAFLLAKQDQLTAAAEQLRRAIHLRYDEPTYYLQLAMVLARQGLYRQAIDSLDEARKHTASTDIVDALAWLLATCPDESLRDAERALELNDLTLRARQPDKATYLDTRAAALAAAGQFQEAADTAAQARQLARQTGRYDQAVAIGARRQAYLNRRLTGGVFDLSAHRTSPRRQAYLDSRPGLEPNR